MTEYVSYLTQRARLLEFVRSESGTMSAKKAAQMGVVLSASTLAALVLGVDSAKADHCKYCDPMVPGGGDAWCASVYGQGFDFCRTAMCTDPSDDVCNFVCKTLNQNDC